MVIVCAYCGKPFTVYNHHHHKYCPECKKSSQRYNEQFQERKKNDPVLRVYTSTYSKAHALYKKGQITKDTLDTWRQESVIKRHGVSIGAITVEEYAEWCRASYQAIKGSKGGVTA